MKQILQVLSLTISLVAFSHAQLKSDFNVGFNYPNGTTYNLAKAKKDFGQQTRWNREHNTKIENNALKVKFTKGLFGPDCGFTGATYIKPSQHLMLEYRVKFEKGFDYRKGSKLPGLGGGTTPSGGKPVDDGKGFTARSSWTKERTGLFNVYAYYFDKNAPVYGDNWNSDFVFKADRWYVVRLEVKMNTGSNKNGYCKAFIDGKEVMKRNNVRFMTKGNEIDEVSFSIFMGGNNDSFSPNHTQYLWIDYIKVNRLDDAPNKAPNVSFTSPRNNAVFNVGDNINLKVNASDSDGSIDKVNFNINEEFFKQSKSAPYEQVFTPTAPGTYVIGAKAVDNDGAQKDATVTIVVKDENQIPSVKLTSPSNNAVYFVGDTVPLTADASDSDGSIERVEFHIDDKLHAGDPGVPYSRTYVATKVGTYKVSAIAIDNDGATKKESVTIQVKMNSAPTASFSSPASDIVLDEGYEQLLIVVDASDSDNHDITTELFIDGKAIRKEKNPPYEWGHKVNDDQDFTEETRGLTVGEHVLEVKITDERGAQSIVKRKVTVEGVVTGLDNNSRENDFMAYPNPSQNGVFQLSAPAEWEVVDLNGQSVLSGNSKVINLENRSEGIYILRSEGHIMKLIYNRN